MLSMTCIHTCHRHTYPIPQQQLQQLIAIIFKTTTTTIKLSAIKKHLNHLSISMVRNTNVVMNALQHVYTRTRLTIFISV